MPDDSPPPSPPSPANSDGEPKSSRKRQRQISLEPGPSTPSGSSDIRVPAKKNRRELGSTAEEEGRGASRSPSPADQEPGVSASPPQEMKIRMRQLSQGVEDLRWQQNQSPSDDAEIENEATVAPTVDSTEDVKNGHEEISDKDEKDKGLKRKYLERGTSSEPVQQETGEALKRPRDDPETDENPRETKRPTPPPPEPEPAPAPAPKLSGFMAYASTSSPFAAVKGDNLFKKSSPSPFATAASANASPSPSPFASHSTTPFPTVSSSTSTPKRTPVFGSSSPFGASTKAKQDVLGSTSKLARAKSPVRRAAAGASNNAFSAYATKGAQGFALAERSTPTPQTNGNGDSGSGNASGAEEEDAGAAEERPATTFGEKLRASKDEEAKQQEEETVFNEQEVTTGEEGEETVHQVRGKLFALQEGQWKERGTGLLKINVRRDDGGGARLVMRKEAVYAVLLNVTLFHGMQCVIAQDPRYLRMSVIEEGGATHYNLKVGSAKAAQDLLNEIMANLPPA
ncbi:Nuclear protein export protein [Mycena chlorophos]|uniref:Nuclear protein export protein n=1 Tax=Mycena chlorophos TaxID=658473 RepID=A0A8H6SZN6_MYCCL|nr:Nuclear protein export protein [Mycena chlorophos]